MPELKHGFGAAKMNKDLDERIVPNGEYRDALNIEIGTSEGSNVGTMQTILGNTAMTNTGGSHGMKDGLLGSNSQCVGSVVDEKNNHIYYFVADADNYTDYIFRFDSNTDKIIPIIVDKYQVTQKIVAPTTTSSSDIKTYFSIEKENTSTNGNWTNIRPGMFIQTSPYAIQYGNGSLQQWAFDDYMMVEKIKKNGSGLWDVYIDYSPPGASYNSSLANQAKQLYEEGIDSGGVNQTNLDAEVTFRAERVLNFGTLNSDGQKTIITGINIFDGMLLWTDGITEPKKIIIEDFIKDRRKGFYGTHQSGELHSFFNAYTTNSSKPPVKNHETLDNGLMVCSRLPTIDLITRPTSLREEHITTIKKSPLHPPALIMSNTSNIRFTSSNGVAQLNGKIDPAASGAVGNEFFVSFEQTNLPAGFVKTIRFDNPRPDYVAGDLVILRRSGPFLPTDMDDFELIVEILEYSSASGYATVKINYTPKTSVGSYTQTTGVPIAEEWHSALQQEKPLYEFKMPKFAFRWKYQDNQYSSYSPFSEVAFLPGSFDYVPKEGYNLGMVNTLRSVYITDFATDMNAIPKDVVEIDILYKESNSINIYKVKTIKFPEEEWFAGGSAINASTSSSYRTTGRIQITSEMVRSAVAANQLLRPWDNVPRTAKAQEVVGNRVVYANYLQNYNL